VENSTKHAILQPWLEPPRFAPGGLFDRATRHDALWTAWERVRANNGAAGGDGMTVARFGQAAHGRLSRLSHDLRNGRYRPGPVRRVMIPKADGGSRPLDIPPVADRIAQAAVAQILTPLLDPEFEDASFAYRPGRSVMQAVARVAKHRREGFRWVVDGDIVRDFERIPHDRLLARLERSVEDAALVDLIGTWLEHHSHAGRGLPQGSPLSPLLANLHLDDVDGAIAGRGLRLVRFADDFLILCRDEALAEGAKQRMAALLAEHGLELNAEKSRITSFDQGVRFLGHLFVKGMVVREIPPDAMPGEDAVARAERLAATPGDAVETAAPEQPVEPRSAPGRWAARQRVMYVLQPGRLLTAEGESFVVREAEAVLVRLAPHRVDRIEVGRGVRLDDAALDLAAATDTVLLRTDGWGRALGRWTPAGSDRARRHLAQAAVALDPVRRIALARRIVGGRILAQRTLLKRLARGRRSDAFAAGVVRAAPRLRRMARAAELSPKLDTPAALTGQEGEAGAIYWPLLALSLGKPELFGGQRRRRRGEDPVNAVLDLLSSLLARDMEVALERHGLHTGFAVLHAAEDGVEALVHDLMEEFRAPVVEACALALFGRRALELRHFERWGADGWRLTDEGYAACIRGYEAWVARPVTGQRSGEKMLWRGVMEEQALAYAAHCEDGVPYEPYRMDY
jgi:CRISPR-associated protein Cas1